MKNSEKDIFRSAICSRF